MKRGLIALTVGLSLATAGWCQTKPAAPAPKPPTFPPLSPKLPKETQASLLSERAETLQNGALYPEAAALLQQAAELTPDDWSLWNRAGWAYLDAGQAEPARKAFENAKKGAPSGTPVWGGTLIAEFALGHKDAALQVLKQVLPPNRLEAATAVVTKGIAAQPRSADWDYALGFLYTRVLDASPRGIPPLEALVLADPKRADGWLLLAELNQHANRVAQEDAAAVKYLDLEPESVDAYRLRAERYALQKQAPQALAEYEAGIVKYPAAAELYYAEARVYERGGAFPKAEAVYKKLIAAAETAKNDGLRAEARAQLANYQARRQNYTAAEAFYREAAARPEASATVWNSWGYLLVLTGKWDEAAKALAEAATRDAKATGRIPADAQGDLVAEHYRAALCRLAGGAKEPAQALLQGLPASPGQTRSSARAESDAFLAWYAGRNAGAAHLAYQLNDERWAAFTWRRRPEEGEFEIRYRTSLSATAWRAILQQVQKKYPDAWPADYALARIYASGGFTEDALALLKKVTTARPDWWAPHFALGQYYSRERNKDEGVPALKKTLQLAPGCRQAKVYLGLLRNLKDEDSD